MGSLLKNHGKNSMKKNRGIYCYREAGIHTLYNATKVIVGGSMQEKNKRRYI